MMVNSSWDDNVICLVDRDCVLDDNEPFQLHGEEEDILEYLEPVMNNSSYRKDIQSRVSTCVLKGDLAEANFLLEDLNIRLSNRGVEQ